MDEAAKALALVKPHTEDNKNADSPEQYIGEPSSSPNYLTITGEEVDLYC